MPQDAELAFQCGAQAIFISNHGGRQLDLWVLLISEVSASLIDPGSAPAPITVLHEIHQKRPDLLKDREVYIDGGVTRGTDVLKALCLGARAVGLGRAFLYANGVWGEEGCRRVVESEWPCLLLKTILLTLF
jgi:L-lactate dehydrogenase (cytochrome)